jgi:hypothetical protein
MIYASVQNGTKFLITEKVEPISASYQARREEGIRKNMYQ